VETIDKFKTNYRCIVVLMGCQHLHPSTETCISGTICFTKYCYFLQTICVNRFEINSVCRDQQCLFTKNRYTPLVAEISSTCHPI